MRVPIAMATSDVAAASARGLLEGEASSARPSEAAVPVASTAIVAATAASAAAEDAASPWAEFIKSIVFGGLDGIVTTFAIIASVEGASFPTQVVLLTGFAKLLGDGLAMGIGDAMSESAEQHHILGEAKREAWEYENYPEGGENGGVEALRAQRRRRLLRDERGPSRQRH